MITLKDFMEATNYRITEGSDYGWQCYGHNAYTLDSWNGDIDGHSFSIIFDTSTQEVYEVTAYDYPNDRAYRLINPDYATAHSDEAARRGIDDSQAWDEVAYTELEVVEDYLEKVQGILSGEDYDTRIQVPLTLPDDALFQLMQLAHAADQTLNDFVAIMLKNEIDRLSVDKS